MLSSKTYSQPTANSTLKFDHILLFVDQQAIKDRLDQIFTPAAKLRTEHPNQGTVGYYYLFYNSYIELLFLEDSAKAQSNQANFGSDYLRRWSAEKSNCPIAFGMLMNPWPSDSVPANFHKYQSQDSPEDEYYLMSVHNTQLNQPLIYASMPQRAYDAIDSIAQVEERPAAIRADLRKYLSHPSQVKRISRIVYTHPNPIQESGNLEILRNNPAITIESAEYSSLSLYFDLPSKRTMSLKLNQHTELIIHY